MRGTFAACVCVCARAYTVGKGVRNWTQGRIPAATLNHYGQHSRPSDSKPPEIMILRSPKFKTMEYFCAPWMSASLPMSWYVGDHDHTRRRVRLVQCLDYQREGRYSCVGGHGSQSHQKLCRVWPNLSPLYSDTGNARTAYAENGHTYAYFVYFG